MTHEKYVKLCEQCAETFNHLRAVGRDPLTQDGAAWCAECLPHIRSSRIRGDRTGIERPRFGKEPDLKT